MPVSYRSHCLLLLLLLLQAIMELSPSSTATSSKPQQQLELPLLLQQALLHFNLWLLLGQTKHVTPAAATRQMLNTIMAALAVIAEQAATLAVEYGTNTAAVEAVCSSARRKLEDAVTERQLEEAAKWRLPAFGFGSSSSFSAAATAAAAAGDASAGSWMLPTGTVPAKLAAGAEQQGLEEAKQRAERNLGSLPYAAADLPLQTTLQQLLQLLQLCSSSATAAASRDVAMQHGLRSVEVFLRPPGTSTGNPSS
jgi:hypothetical protein